MKKLTQKQMFSLADFLCDCCQNYEDDYSERAVNKTLEILGYSNEFRYDNENDAIICDGGIELPEDTHDN